MVTALFVREKDYQLWRSVPVSLLDNMLETVDNMQSDKQAI